MYSRKNFIKLEYHMIKVGAFLGGLGLVIWGLTGYAATLTSVLNESESSSFAEMEVSNANDSPENVKSKTLFLSIIESKVVIPLGYSYDSRLLFGASYKVEGTMLCANSTDVIDYFISPVQNGQLIDVYFSSKDDLSSFSDMAGKFLISVTLGNNSDLYVVEFSGGKFLKPIPLEVNSNYSENSASFSPDGEKIYFSSNRPGGFGGFDIYEIELVGKGKWSEPKNLGENVNSSFDEQCPYVLRDGMTLYFSSKGHQSEGDFDIYVVTLDDIGEWGEADKLGLPINSDSDDLFYRLSPDENRAVYYTLGDSGAGIYQLEFN